MLAGAWYAWPWLTLALQRQHLASAPPPDLAAGARRLAVVTTLPLTAPQLAIDKSERRLTLYDGAREIKRYKIALGRAPVGHKQAEGDNRTPVGRYYICVRTQETPYHLFMGLSYPNADDARTAQKAGLLDTNSAGAIIAAENARQSPPWNTVLGGAIGIHGMGSFGDWTLGCMALDNADIEELWAATGYWTPVEITE
ncbi:MAG TPA: L,D-transpeptidase family protein [bacterium]|nr:L,D-transpeptidase family protein [bacterium]